MKNGDKPIYPSQEKITSEVPGVPFDLTTIEYHLGITKREYFAALALQGLARRIDVNSTGFIVRKSVEMADALLQELEK